MISTGLGWGNRCKVLMDWSRATSAWVLVMLCLAMPTRSQVRYNLTEIAPPERYVTDYAKAINDLGQVTGYFSNMSDGYFFVCANGIQYAAFLYARGTLTNLGEVPQVGGGCPQDINNRGEIAGVAGVLLESAFVYRDGILHNLRAYSASGGCAVINSKGQIAGIELVLTDVIRDGELVDYLASDRAYTQTAVSSGSLFRGWAVKSEAKTTGATSWARLAGRMLLCSGAEPWSI
jgi:probable HAF family extracellular repeat protein